jgi:hypothetical protein
LTFRQATLEMPGDSLVRLLMGLHGDKNMVFETMLPGNYEINFLILASQCN